MRNGSNVRSVSLNIAVLVLIAVVFTRQMLDLHGVLDETVRGWYGDVRIGDFEHVHEEQGKLGVSGGKGSMEVNSRWFARENDFRIDIELEACRFALRRLHSPLQRMDHAV